MSDTDEKKFNETLKRMLKTPPTPHEKLADDKALPDSKQNITKPKQIRNK